MTEEELLAEEYICNGKCQDDITRNYVHCKTCTRLKDFLAGYKVGKTDLEKENAELKEYNKYLRRKRQGGIQKQYNKVAIIKQQDDQLTKAKELLERFLGLGNLWDLDCKDYFPLRKEVEQFLNSEVEK